ncbi:MAG: hypothetical protein ABMA00_12775 [Gemmatimonas sp.]
MRAQLVLIVLAVLAGCRQSPSASPAAAPRVRTDTVAVRGAALSAAEIARQQEAGTTVDTIVLATTAITLRPGEEFSLRGLAPVALDRSGERIQSFTPVIVRNRSDVFALSFPMIRALKVGVDSLYIEALPRDPTTDRTPRRPSTRVMITVRQ